MSEEDEWTAEDWRDLHAQASELLARLEELSDRLSRVEARLAWSRKPQPRQRRRAG